MLRILRPTTGQKRAGHTGSIMRNLITLSGYFLACVLALIAAARWIWRHDPAEQDSSPDRPGPDSVQDDPANPPG